MICSRSSRSAWSLAVFTATAVVSMTACGGDDATTNPPPTATADTVDVFTPGYIFSPTTAEIRVGGTIRWRISEANNGTGHNVLFTGSVAGKPADIPIVKNVTVLRTFSRAGTYPYSCTVHPGMDGEVVVR